MGKFLTDVDLNQNELQYAVIQNLNTDPIVSTTGQIYYNTNISKLRLKTLAGWVTITAGTITIPTLQDVVNSGNGISNFGGIGNADILSVNFTNNRSLYLNNSSSPTIKIVDNLNASHNLTIDLDTINLNGTSYNWSTIVNPSVGLLSALPFTTDHLTVNNNQYIIGDLVWYLGNVYRCLADNDSIIPTSTLYWVNLGAGYPLIQQPTDWNSTSGNNQILNKPTIPTVGTWGTLNYPTWTTGTPFVKMTAIGTFALDTTTYYPNSNPAGFVDSTYVSSNFYPLSSNPAGYLTTATLPIPTLQQVVNENNLLTDSSITFDSVGNPNLTSAVSIDGLTFIDNDGIDEETTVYASNGIQRNLNANGTLLNFETPTNPDNIVLVPNGSGTLALTSDIPAAGVPYTGATEDVDLGTYSLRAFSLITQTNGTNKSITLSSNNVQGERVAEWQDKDYIGIADITDIPTTTSQLTNDGADGVNPFITAADIPPSTNGLPTGGTTGQILTKVDATDYNATWQDNYADWTSVVKHTVKNNGASGTITKGTAVYVTGASGTNMLVGRASNASESTSSKTMGLMQSNITTTGGTQTGFVVTEGLLGGLNTAGTTAGDPVWLGVNGALIYGLINKPYAPAHLVFIGIVTKVSAGNGEIFVKVQNGFELKELHDVQAQSPSLNDILWYDNAVSPAQWKTASISTILGYTPGTVTSVAALTLGTTGTDLTSTIADGTTTPVITLNVPTASATNRGALSSSDWKTFNNITLISDGIPGTPVTGGAGLVRQLIKSYSIPANTFGAGDTFEVWLIGSKVNTNTVWYTSISVGPSNSLAGSTEISRASAVSAVTYMPHQRIFNFTTSTNLRGQVANSSAISETSLVGASTTNTTFNTAADNWILISVYPLNSGTVDIMNIEKVFITRNRYRITP